MQHGASVAIVDCHIKDAALWQQRVEERVTSDEGSDRGHKPQSWAALQALVDRHALVLWSGQLAQIGMDDDTTVVCSYGGSHEWAASSLSCETRSLSIDTGLGSAAEHCRCIAEWISSDMTSG